MLTFRIGRSERKMLAALAERDGLSMSDWLRLTIRRSHSEAFGSADKSTPKRRQRQRREEG